MDIFGESVDKARDLPADRVFPVANGSSFIVKVVDPYGFWRIHREKGQIPEELKGDYTSLPYAEAAIKNYLNRKKA